MPKTLPIVIFVLLTLSNLRPAKAQMWNELGVSKTNIYSIAVDDSSNVYASGYFVLNNKQAISKWNGTAWIELGNGANALNINGTINSIITDDSGNVYAAGNNRNTSNKYYVAKWNGTTWTELGMGLNGFNSTINTLAIDDSGYIYAAGNFTNSQNKCYVAKWDGTNWKELGAVPYNLNANYYIYSITVDKKGNVYAAGNFTNINFSQYVAKWNGKKWSELGGTNGLNAKKPIYSIALDSSGILYAAGAFTNTVCKWNGKKWSYLVNSAAPLKANDNIYSICTDIKGNVYAAGNFTDSNSYSLTGKRYVAKWDGSKWSKVGKIPFALNANNAIRTIATDTMGNIYAGGDFTDSTFRQYVASYSCNKLKAPTNITQLSRLTICSGDSTILSVQGKGIVTWYTDSVGGQYLYKGSDYTTSALSKNTIFYAQDSNLCGVSESRTRILVSVLPKPNAYIISQSNLKCFGDTNGSAILNIYGGTGTVLYKWIPNVSTNLTATNLSSGDYIFTATDSNLCSTSQTITITQPPVISSSIISQTNLKCNADSNGQTVISASGGMGSYTYSWYPYGGNSDSAFGLKATTYTCTITDSNFCTAKIKVDISEPVAISTGILSKTNIACNGDSTGSASILASSNYGILSYNWSPTGGNNTTASGLKAGTYICTVTDNNSCTRQQKVIITEPSPIITNIIAQNNPTCYGDNNGSAAVSVTGGVGYYKYYWQPNVGNGSTVKDLAAGKYTCYIYDSNFCNVKQNVIITQPNIIDTSINQTSNTLKANTSALSYQWITCSDYLPIIGATHQSFTPTNSGNYAVIINQATCSDTSSCYYIYISSVEHVYNNNLRISQNNSEISIDGLFPIKADINLYDMTGRNIYKHTTNGITTLRLSTTSFAKGLYILSVGDERMKILIY